MIVRIPLASFEIFYFIFAYEFHHTISENPLAELFDAPPGTKMGRVTVFDVTQDSSVFLTGKTTQVSIDLGNDMTYQLILSEPSDADSTFNDIRRKIGETPAQKDRKMRELINELKSDINLDVPTDNAAWLIRFLRARDYDVPKTVKLINKYYKFKTEHEEVFRGLIPSEQKDIFEDDIISLLPSRDQSGARVLIARPGLWSGQRAHTIKLCKITITFLEIGVYEPGTQLGGMRLIVDMAGMGKNQFKHVSISKIKTMLYWMKNCVPLKLHGIHIVNPPSWFWFVEKTLIRFIVGEIKDIFYVHYDFDSFHKYVWTPILPKEYGGHFDMFKITPDEWEVFLKHQDKEYEKLASYGFKPAAPKKQKHRASSSNTSR